MGQPSGEVIARPMVARACGCLREFQHYAVDKYRAQRLAKFQSTRCSDCVAKLVEEQQRAAAALPTKGEADAPRAEALWQSGTAVVRGVVGADARVGGNAAHIGAPGIAGIARGEGEYNAQAAIQAIGHHVDKRV